MGILNRFFEGETGLFFNHKNDLSLRTKLLITLVPSMVLILLIMGSITYHSSHLFLNQILGRASRIQTKAMAHEIELTLARCRRDLQVVARNFSDPAQLRNYFASLKAGQPANYCAMGYLAQTHSSHVFWIAKENQLVRIPAARMSEIAPDPFLLIPHLNQLKSDEVWISEVFEAEFPVPLPESPNQKMGAPVICFAVPCFSEGGSKSGYLMLFLDVRHLRNILSLYTSPESPVWASPRTSEYRFAYFFDLKGWILFQSEDPGQNELDLTTDVVRSNFKNSTLSKPGLPFAFQPSSQYDYFWKMVGDVTEGRQDLIEMHGPPNEKSSAKEYFFTYAPVFFQKKVIGGIGYVDRTRFTLEAGYKHLNTMLFLSLATIMAVMLIIFILSYLITRPIYKLAAVVNDIEARKELAPIELNLSGHEARLLQRSINHLIQVHNRQIEEIRSRDLTIRQAEFKEKIELDDAVSMSDPEEEMDLFPEIVGIGPKTRQLKSDLKKAALAAADVLIMGETGSGKQLAAEAIHRNSSCGKNPFISINCGELSENLLLDTLFGHVKGAFTEAKADRKGAFPDAHGGTLFLDEIQNASLTVQQALLRAVDLRRIKPLGTDREIEVDVRLICATNADLKGLIETGQFRGDLYYRLKVITIHTPPLREYKESIPVLVGHFIRQLKESTGRDNLGLSKGALEKLKGYHWPGNIRELKHCITRAAVMAEEELIQADDIHLDEQAATDATEKTISDLSVPPPEEVLFKPQKSTPQDHPIRKGSERPLPEPLERHLNKRQQEVYPYIRKNKIITRKEYQHRAGDGISNRTAIYDLKDLVEKGVLKKEGNGSATRYILIERNK